MTSLERNYFWGKFFDSSSTKSGLFLTPDACIGCTLSKDKPEVKWLETDDKESAGEVDILNQLALSQVCILRPKLSVNVRPSLVLGKTMIFSRLRLVFQA